MDENDKHCPVCSLEKGAVFHLAGICRHSFIDRLYVLQTETSLLGYIQTSLDWNETEKRWEITNLLRNTLEAFMDSGRDLPIGVHPWHFTENCSDPSGGWRSLNLHRAVPQPGSYCCDTGNCLDSEQGSKILK